MTAKFKSVELIVIVEENGEPMELSGKLFQEGEAIQLCPTATMDNLRHLTSTLLDRVEVPLKLFYLSDESEVMPDD